jgi:hypothetical protein
MALLDMLERQCFGLWSKGPAHKKKPGTPVVGGWVRVRKRDGVRFVSSIFFIVFLDSPHRETPKNVIKKIEKTSVLDFWSNFLKNFSTLFFCKKFF